VRAPLQAARARRRRRSTPAKSASGAHDRRVSERTAPGVWHWQSEEGGSGFCV